MSERPHRDVASNRRAVKWRRRELAVRALWELLRGPLFVWTPRPLWGWRRFVLRAFGATVGARTHLHPTVRIAVPWTLKIGDDVGIGEGAILYALGEIVIGDRATVSQYAHLCGGTHNHRDPAMPLVKASIEIGDEAWVCADAFVGPGVSIGARAIVGARAVVVKDVAADHIVAGNPARIVKSRIGEVK